MQEFIMTVGLPASGKSFYVNQFYKDYEVVSSDSIRKELYGDESIQGSANEVFSLALRRVKSSLEEGKSVVLDATNVRQKNRVHILEQLPQNIHKIAFVFCIPLDNCLESNSQRERVVPESVIYRMYKQFEPPHYREGFDEVRYISDGGEDWESLDEMLGKNITCPHDNPHHSLSCGEHCLECERLMREKLKNEEMPEILKSALTLAARYHDLSKYKVKHYTSKDSYAHYYGHEKASAYDFLCGAAVEYYSMADNKNGASFFLQEISNLISNHMVWFNENSIEKKTKLYGEAFMKRLKLLNECDIAAH